MSAEDGPKNKVFSKADLVYFFHRWINEKLTNHVTISRLDYASTQIFYNIRGSFKKGDDYEVEGSGTRTRYKFITQEVVNALLIGLLRRVLRRGDRDLESDLTESINKDLF